MNTKILTCFFLCFAFCATGQNVVVDYDSFKDAAITPKASNDRYQLIKNNTASSYIKLPEDNDANENIIDVGLTPSVYKDLIDGVVYKQYTTFRKNMTVKDTLSKLFDWKLVTGSKEIIGYECKKALLNYRGRDYEAWYAPEIPVPNGPYKFHGLPGMILAIKTTPESPDNFKLEIEAKGIQFPDKPITIDNPFQNDEIYSWKEFTDAFNKVYQKLKHYVKRDENSITTIQIKMIDIEVYVYE